MRAHPIDRLVDPAHLRQSAPADFAQIDAACRQVHLTWTELRIAHWECGGNAGADELAAFLAGTGELDDREYDRLAAAVNDRLIGAGIEPCIPYRDD